MKKIIAVVAGDGIGPEVMQQCLRVLEHIADNFQHQFEYQHALIGGAAYEHYQIHCPDETLAICDAADAILFGSVGGPLNQQHLKKWQNCEANSLLKIRKHFNLAVNIRPIQVYTELAHLCPLKTERIQQGVDMLIFRELTGGIYFGNHQQSNKDNQRQASDECVYDEAQVRTIAHKAFQAAEQRQNKLCSVDKANVLATSKLWRDIVNDVANDYPCVELTHMLVDNCALQLVINPSQFDVIVTENMFGDILSDLAAALPGSLGLMPSASFNRQSKGLFEPSGGSAPELTGKKIANPCAQILSAAMMLRQAFAMYKEADLIESAIKATFGKGIMTADLADNDAHAVSTAEFVDVLLNEMTNLTP